MNGNKAKIIIFQNGDNHNIWKRFKWISTTL
jgi:hypothetical protein